MFKVTERGWKGIDGLNDFRLQRVMILSLCIVLAGCYEKVVRKDDSAVLSDQISKTKEFVDEVIDEEYGRFSDFDLRLLFINNVDLEVAYRYAESFNVDSIILMYLNDLMPEEVNSLSYMMVDHIIYLKKNVTDEVVAKFDSRFSLHDIIYLHKQNITLEFVNKFNSRFEFREIELFYEFKIPVSFIESFPDKYSGFDIYKFYKNGFSYDEVKLFDDRFDASEVVFFKVNNYLPEEVNLYDKRFTGDDVFFFIKDRVSYDLANAFDPKFSPNNILSIVKAGIMPEIANELSLEEADQKVREYYELQEMK